MSKQAARWPIFLKAKVVLAQPAKISIKSYASGSYADVLSFRVALNLSTKEVRASHLVRPSASNGCEVQQDQAEHELLEHCGASCSDICLVEVGSSWMGEPFPGDA